MLNEDLNALGFGKNEAIVYKALFELGRVKVQAIIKHTHLHPNLVYPALDALVEKRLISKIIRKGVGVFEANDPIALVRYIEEKKELANSIAEKLKKQQTERSREIVVYEGVEGVRRTREQALAELKAGDFFYVLGASHDTSTELEAYWKKFNTRMIKNGIDYKLLFDKEAKEIILNDRSLNLNIHARKLPFGVDIPMFVAFYKDTLNITVGTHDLITFSIRNQAAVNSFKKYFEYFWNNQVLPLKLS